MPPLQAFPSNELVEKTVGKTLAKIMSDSIDDLIITLKSPDASEAEKQNAMRLLAALALDSSTGGDMIAKRGGVGAIIGAFKNAQGAAAIEQTARAIANLAATRTNIEELVKENAIPELITMLNSGKGSAKVRDGGLAAQHHAGVTRSGSHRPRNQHQVCCFARHPTIPTPATLTTATIPAIPTVRPTPP